MNGRAARAIRKQHGVRHIRFVKIVRVQRGDGVARARLLVALNRRGRRQRNTERRRNYREAARR